MSKEVSEYIVGIWQGRGDERIYKLKRFEAPDAENAIRIAEEITSQIPPPTDLYLVKEAGSKGKLIYQNKSRKSNTYG